MNSATARPRAARHRGALGVHLPFLLCTLLLASCQGGGSSGGSSDDKTDAFSIDQAAVANAVVSAPYSAQLGASNGTAPVAFSWASGYTPPAWLSLSAGGELSGTPTSVGALTLSVRAVDSSSLALVATRDIQLEVLAAPEISTAGLSRAIKGQSYGEQLACTGGAGLSVQYALAATSTLPAGISLSTAGLLSGAPTEGGLFELEIELRHGQAAVDTALLDLVVYESIPYTYVEDGFEPNDSRGAGTQLFPGNSPAGRMTGADRHVQREPLTLNSDQNIAKPDPDDYFRFNTGMPGTITAEVFFRGLVGEVDAYLWYYDVSTHLVSVAAESAASSADDERIVLYNAPAGYYYLQIAAPYDVSQGFYNANAYSFRVSFNELTIATELLEADSASGSVDAQVVAYRQGGSPSQPTWTLLSGTPPSGVSFTLDGRFTGTPSQLGLFDFTVQVEDGGSVETRDIRVRFFDSVAGDYWTVKGERRLYDPANGDPILDAYGDAAVVAPHPDYPAEGAIYLLGGRTDTTLAGVRVFHTDRAGIPADKQFRFEDQGKDMSIARRYLGAVFVQHSYGGYIYAVGGEVGAASGGHASGDFWYGVDRLQVADGSGAALAHPLSTNWEAVADLPRDDGGLDVMGWAEFGLAAQDAPADAYDRIYLLGGRYQVETAPGSNSFAKMFHDQVLMYECPTSAIGAGVWHRKLDSVPYTPRRFPAVAMVNGCIYLIGGREGTVGRTGSGSAVTDYIEMYQPDPAGQNMALSVAGAGLFPHLSEAVYAPFCAQIGGSVYVWGGWDANLQGTRQLQRFDFTGASGIAADLMEADWGVGFGPGIAHNGKLWILSGIGHMADSEPASLNYTP